MPEDDFDGFEEDEDVHPDGPALDVFVVEFGAAFEGGLVAAGDLPEAGDAGDDLDVVFVVGAVHDLLVGQDGAGADQAHFAADDVEELGEFIEAVFAQEFAEAGDARVVFELLVAVPFLLQFRVLGEVAFEDLIGADVHGAELEEGVFFAVAADTGLAVKDAAGGIELDEGGDQAEQGRD